MSDPHTAPLLPIVLAVIAVAAVALVALLVYRRRGAKRRVERALKSISVEQLRNVFVPDGLGGQVHIDRLLLTQDGLLVLDIRDVSGNVFGASQMNEWTVLGDDGRWTFPNPAGPLSERVLAVRALAQSVPVTGHIVFTSAASFPRGMPEGAITLDELVKRYGSNRRKDAPAIEAFYSYWSRIRDVAQPA